MSGLGQAFGVSDDLIVGLAAAAGVAIDNARLHERVARLALADDRARIARDLHDTVIQRLFATGLSLQATVTLCGDEHPEAAERIGTAIDELDLTVKHIRTVIFGLDGGRHGASLRDDVLATCQEAAGPLGFAPRTVFEGPVDAVVPTDLRDDVLAVLRESLTNVARHAGARRVDVAVHASPSALEVTVDDDGRGGALPRDGGRGIRNLRSRAETRNGTYAVDDRPAGGTRVRWTVPLP